MRTPLIHGEHGTSRALYDNWSCDKRTSEGTIISPYIKTLIYFLYFKIKIRYRSSVIHFKPKEIVQWKILLFSSISWGRGVLSGWPSPQTCEKSVSYTLASTALPEPWSSQPFTGPTGPTSGVWGHLSQSSSPSIPGRRPLPCGSIPVGPGRTAPCRSPDHWHLGGPAACWVPLSCTWASSLVDSSVSLAPK